MHALVAFTVISTDKYNCYFIRLILSVLFQKRLCGLPRSLTNIDVFTLYEFGLDII